MHAEELSRLVGLLTPDDDPCLKKEFEPYLEKVRVALGSRSNEIIETLDRWLRHSLYEFELLENGDDLCIDVAHFMLLSHSTDGCNESHVQQGIAGANWNAAIRTSLTYRTNFKDTQGFENDLTRAEFPRYRNTARAAKRYRELGVQIFLENGDLRISTEEYLKIFNLAYESIKSLGGINLLPRIINAIQPYYISEFDRYVIPRQTGTTDYLRDPSYPLGLLYNMSLDCLDSKEFEEPDNNAISKAIEMVRDFVSLWEIEPYTSYGQASRDLDSLFDVLQSAFAFDEAISIRQANFRNVITLCSTCFEESVIQRTLGIKLAELHIFLHLIETTIGEIRGCTLIPRIVLEQKLSKLGVSESSIEKLLTIFSPSTKNEATWKPLSCFHNELYVPDIRTVAEKFFTAVIRSASSSDQHFKSLVGNAFEIHIRDLLITHNIEVTHGKYSFTGGNGECDAIVETSKSIFLLEIKNRNLTPESRFGSTDRLFRDLMHGLFKSQVQAARAENTLYRLGHLRLENGYEVKLNGRQIERVSVVPFSYGILHYRRIREDALRFLSKISVSYERGDLKVDRYRDFLNLARLRQAQIMELHNLNVTASLAPDFRSHLLDYDMLTYLLRNVNNNETFGQAIIDGSNIELATFDWWAERWRYEDRFNVS